MPSPNPAVRCEQAVYGSFPFWDRGYAVLAHSPGCRPEWLSALKAACQRFGERPRGVDGPGGMFAMRVGHGPWMVVGASLQGADDRGRPGALAFHALFVAPKDYERLGADPFALAGALRSDWGPETSTLPTLSVEVPPPTSPSPADDRGNRIAEVLAKGRRIALESPGPIDDLARSVWQSLPTKVRRRASLATWAFANGNRFDLAAFPRLAGVELDATYLDPSHLSVPTPPRRRRPGRPAILAGAALALLLGTVGLALSDRGTPPAPEPPPPARPGPAASLPDPATYPVGRTDPAERSRVAEALVDLADRFDALEPGDPAGDPSALMVRLADRLRYRGPRLSAGELATLSRQAGPEAGRALAWHRALGRFAPDRPLPADFDRGPLRWQLDVLCWSFRVPPDPGLSAAEVPMALADALAVDVPTRPLGLADRYPALDAYARFLGRLPRR